MRNPVVLKQRLNVIGCGNLPPWVMVKLQNSFDAAMQQIESEENARIAVRIDKRRTRLLARSVTTRRIAALIAEGQPVGDDGGSKGESDKDSPLANSDFSHERSDVRQNHVVGEQQAAPLEKNP